MRTHLFPDAASEGGGGQKITMTRQPTADELKVTFTDDPTISISEPVPVTPTPTAPVVPVEPKLPTEPVAPKVPATKVLETKSTEPAKNEPKNYLKAPADPKAKVEPKAPVVDPTKNPVVPVEPIAPSTTKAFDYTPYSPEEANALRQMSTQGRDFTSGLIKKTKELEGLSKAQFTQHPLAYTLDPQYQQFQADANFADFEAKHYQQQVLNIKAGNKWTPLIGYDDKGHPRFGAERDPSPEAEERVRAAMNQCLGLNQQAQAKAQQYAGQYNQVVQQSNQAINNERAKRFAWVADPSVLKHSLEVPGVGDVTVEKIRNDFIDLLPPQHRQGPVADVAADMFVALQIYAAQIRDLQSQGVVAQTKIEEAHRIEPSSTERPAAAPGKPVNGIKEFTLAGMPS